jgi:uncharacterized protein (TIGR00730 family)
MADAEPRQPRTLDEEIIAAEQLDVASTLSDTDREERILEEVNMGFEALGHVGAAVSIFGSARTPRDDPEYLLAEETARLLGNDGFAIITGGGPGIMEAANKGARESHAQSIGLNIELPFEQGLNPYVELGLEFHYFFTRKVMFVRYASGFVVFPGGFGTLDETFEALTLIQTGKIQHFPLVLVGTAYWEGLAEWLRERMLGEGMISPEDMDLFVLTDDPQEVLRVVREAQHRRPRRPA